VSRARWRAEEGRRFGPSATGLPQGHHVAYGACKALWLGERRLETSGSAKPGWSLFEERECIVALLDAYHSDPKAKPDKDLDRIGAIATAGALDAWILYELASRMDPQIVLKLPRDVQIRVHDFVRDHVLVKQ